MKPTVESSVSLERITDNVVADDSFGPPCTASAAAPALNVKRLLLLYRCHVTFRQHEKPYRFRETPSVYGTPMATGSLRRICPPSRLTKYFAYMQLLVAGIA